MTSEPDFWRQVERKGLPRFRFFRRSLDLAELDRQLQGTLVEEKWRLLKEQIAPGDRIWPFEFHVRSYLGLRRGIAVVRRNKVIGGIVLEVS